MRKFILRMPRKIFIFSFLIFLVIFLGNWFGIRSEQRAGNQEQEIKSARMYHDIHPLITESDLYCSFFILEDEEKPDIKIVGAERGDEVVLLREQDIFYINKGNESGIEPGQIFLILEMGPKIKSPIGRKKYGQLALKRGRAEIVAVASNRASARLDKACGQVTAGQFLVPFEERTGLVGKDLGYEDISFEEEGTGGLIVYLQNDWGQIGTGNWALIDLGAEDGFQFGHQLIAYRVTKEAISPKILGSLIVIDTRTKTSTVKVLSCRDALRVGDRVRTR